MTGKRKFRKSINQLDVKKVDQIIEIPALLGLKLGGEQRVSVPGRSGFVYARIRDNLNEVVQAYNSQVSQVYDLPVILVRDQVNKSRYIVKGRDLGRYSNWGESAYLPRHHSQHEFDPIAPGADVAWIYDKQFMPFAITPSGSSGAGNVITKDTLYFQNATWRYLGVTGTADILAYKPTGSSARMVLVYADENGNPQLLAGSFFSASITGTGGIRGYIPALADPTNHAPLGAVRLVSGTSRILWDNIYRGFLLGGGASGSSGGGVTGMITGSVLFAAADGTATEDNDDFFWNNTTKTLMVGGNTLPFAASSLWKHVVSNNGSAFILSFSYGGSSNLIGYSSRGTKASPLAVTGSSTLIAFGGGGYDGSIWFVGGYVRTRADEDWSSIKHGSKVEILTTQTGSTANLISTTFRPTEVGFSKDINVTGTATANAFVGLSNDTYWNPLVAPVSPHAKDDEFNDSSLDAKWTTWDVDSIMDVEESERGLRLTLVSGTSTNRWAGILQAAPSTPFTIWARFGFAVDGFANDYKRALILGNGLIASPTGTAFYTLADYVGGAGMGIQYLRYSSHTTLAATIHNDPNAVAVWQLACFPRWYRIRVPASNIVGLDTSMDGVSWTCWNDPPSGLDTLLFTPQDIGIGVFADTHAIIPRADFPFFRVTSGADFDSVMYGARVNPVR